MKLSEEELAMMELALFLKMPLYKLVDEMPYDEYLAWFEFMRQRPPGWAEDRRTFLMLSVHAANLKPESIFPTLAQIAKVAGEAKTGLDSLKSSAFFAQMLNSHGGDNLGGLFNAKGSATSD